MQASAPPYTLGVCVMERKANSAPMQEILSRLPSSLFTIVIFGDDTILNKPIEDWPVCNALISFFSSGFPLEKAQGYVRLRRPVIVNDLESEPLLRDRRDVYRILQEDNIPVPRHVTVNRDGYRGLPDSEVIEGEDCIEVDGDKLTKPFVEKPVDGEDHNIYIYYPMSAGGGRKRLFRKVGNRSSEFDPQTNRVRTSGSFIYEEFLSTQGTDVKVYTVGANYAHAEARKSPVLDGRVVRDAAGKEVRYPVILSTKEKDMAQRVSRAFRQTICGFDILRGTNQSFVCDVNGWSFVKNSEKYYEDCATLLSGYLEQALRQHEVGTLDTDLEARGNPDQMPVGFIGADDPFYLSSFHFPEAGAGAQLSEPPTLLSKHGSSSNIYEESLLHASDAHSTSSNLSNSIGPPGEEGEELRCVLAVIRHADRTPKQKMKMQVCHPSFLDFYHARQSDSSKKKDLKIKAVADLEKLLEVSKDLLRRYDEREESFMHFLSTREEKYEEDTSDRMQGYRTLRDVLQRWQLVGINRKVQLKPREYSEPDADGNVQATKLLLILKWGGDLTHSGEEQSESLGKRFRQMMYPGGEGGLLRLHSTFRHDLKIYTSDEGRVQKTAASFAKGLLELEGDLIPILVGLVLKSKDADSMLDPSGSEAQEIIMRVKQRLHKIIHRLDDTVQLLESDSRLIRSVARALNSISEPIKKMEEMHTMLRYLKEQLTKNLQEKARLRAENASKHQDNVLPTYASMERSISLGGIRSRNGSHDHIFPEDDEEMDRVHETNRSKGEEVPPSSPPMGAGASRLLARMRRRVAEEEVNFPEPCGRETLEMMRERWAKLHRDFYNKKSDAYDLSKIPDIHDCIRYDALHNAQLHLTSMRKLLDISSSLSHALVPQEYGINVEEKVNIGAAMCRTLLTKIKDDLDLARGLELQNMHRLNPSYVKDKINSTHRAVRTRLYFTSESHLHTLLNVLRYPRSDSPVAAAVGEEAKKWIETIPELCYMTHFVFRVFERFQYAKDDPQRYRLEISLSPGADNDPLRSDTESVNDVAPLKIISREGVTCQEFVDYLADVINFAEQRLEASEIAKATPTSSPKQSESEDLS